MEDMKGATTMTWEELEDCGVSVNELCVLQFVLSILTLILSLTVL